MRTCVLCTATLLALLAGCVSQPVAPTPATIAAEVMPGDRIRLVTRGGLEGEYRVVRVTLSPCTFSPQDGKTTGTPRSPLPTATFAS